MWHILLRPVEISLQSVLRVTEQVSLWDGDACFSGRVTAGLEAGDNAGIVPPLTARTRRGIAAGAWWKTWTPFTSSSQCHVSKTDLVEELWSSLSPALCCCCTRRSITILKRKKITTETSRSEEGYVILKGQLNRICACTFHPDSEINMVQLSDQI